MKTNIKRALSIIEEEKPPLQWHQTIWHSRSKFEAIAAGCMVYVASGMKLAWCIYETPSGKFLVNHQTHVIVFSWFVGVLVGALLATAFVQRVTKNAAHCLSGVLLLAGGVLLMSLPIQWLAISVSCLCEGCAYGLAHVQTTMTAADIAPSQIRGLLLSFERIFIWLGVCLQLVYTRFWFGNEPVGGHHLYVDQPHGIAITIMGALTIVLTLLYQGESPLLLSSQRKAQRQRQHQTMRQESKQRELPTPDIDNRQIFKRLISVQFADECNDHYEVQQLLLYDAGLSWWAAMRLRNAWPLLKVLCLRCFVTISLSLPFNRFFYTLSENAFHCDSSCLYFLPLSGLLGSIIGALRIDTRGRRRTAVLSLLFAAVAIFIMSGILRHGRSEPNGVSNNLELELIACLMLCYQFVLNIGVSLSSTVYTGEAFTPSVKATCVSILLIAEQLLHIALVIITFTVCIDYAAFFFFIGCLCLLLALMTFCIMPETRHLTLLRCIQKFNKFP